MTMKNRSNSKEAERPFETELVSFGESPIHGIGGFARSDIAPGARVLEYVGEKIDKRESLLRCERNNQCIFSLNDHEDLDGSVDWNLARWINHSCAPNCDALLIDGRVWLLANRQILAGEEITINYGYDLDDYKAYPCTCGSPECVGYIVAQGFFEHVQKQQL